MLVNEGTNPNKYTIQGIPKKGVKNFLRLNALIKKKCQQTFLFNLLAWCHFWLS